LALAVGETEKEKRKKWADNIKRDMLNKKVDCKGEKYIELARDHVH
jgi:hypothetical protein